MSTDVAINNHRTDIHQYIDGYMTVDVHGINNVRVTQVTDSCTQLALTSNNYNGEPEHVVIYLYDINLADILRAVAANL